MDRLGGNRHLLRYLVLYLVGAGLQRSAARSRAWPLMPLGAALRSWRMLEVARHPSPPGKEGHDDGSA
jgi:hypothetical protein